MRIMRGTDYEILTKLEKKIQNDIIKVVLKKEYDSAIFLIADIHDALYVNIPDNKLVSYGRVHIIKVLS